jgi:hypothetical protein
MRNPRRMVRGRRAVLNRAGQADLDLAVKRAVPAAWKPGSGRILGCVTPR